MRMLFTIIIFKGMAVLFLLHMIHGRTLPGPAQQQHRGRTLHPCPERCRCFNHTVACNSLQLLTVPGELPAKTRVLYLNDNSLQNIDFDVILKLRELEELYVQGNQITGFHRQSIASFQKLRMLDLRNNPLVCDCKLAKLATGRLQPATGVKLRLDETKCAFPPKYAGRSVHKVLQGLQCEKRGKRFADEECYPGYCWNEGECVEHPEGRSCICPSFTTGLRCETRIGTSRLRETEEEEGTVTISIYRRPITSYDTIEIYWTIHPPKPVSYYMLYIDPTDADSGEKKSFRSDLSHYTFTDLQPTTWYSVCVEAVSVSWGGPFARKCKSMQTRPSPHPGPGHPPTKPEPDTSPHYPGKEPDDNELIHHAAVILGSVIGVCAFLIIFLTLGYKFRTLRHRQSHSSESSTASPTATTTETVSDTVNPTSNPAQEIIVLSVPSAESGTASGEVGAPDPEEGLEAAAATASNPIAINSVLQALKQQGVCRQQGVASANAVVFYRSGPESNSTADGSFPEQHPSSESPIYIVSNGTRYPIDPALSDVLRSAISGTGPHVPPIPDEPPPPYSERDESLPPPLIYNGAVEEENSNRENGPVFTSEAESPDDLS